MLVYSGGDLNPIGYIDSDFQLDKAVEIRRLGQCLLLVVVL